MAMRTWGVRYEILVDKGLGVGSAEESPQSLRPSAMMQSLQSCGASVMATAPSLVQLQAVKKGTKTEGQGTEEEQRQGGAGQANEKEEEEELYRKP